MNIAESVVKEGTGVRERVCKSGAPGWKNGASTVESLGKKPGSRRCCGEEARRTFSVRVILGKLPLSPQWINPAQGWVPFLFLGHFLRTVLSVGLLWGLDSWDVPGESCRSPRVGDQDMVNPCRTPFADKFLEGTGREKNMV